MLLAARALGLGATLKTLYLNFEKEVETALGLPPDVHSYALLPIGYPIGRFGPVRRAPLADVVKKISGISLTGREAGRGARRRGIAEIDFLQRGRYMLGSERKPPGRWRRPLGREPALFGLVHVWWPGD
jgi:hypothetical protein